MNVLIIEDDAEVMRVVASIVRRFAEEVQCVDMLSKAMAMVRLFMFDLILLDLRLPDSSTDNSKLAIRSFKHVSPNTAIVVMTGTSVDRSEVMKYGADGYIQKPPHSWQHIVPEIISAFRNSGREDYQVFVNLLSKVANDKGNGEPVA